MTTSPTTTGGNEYAQTVRVTWHQSGQPRAYADSIYDATIEFETTATWAQCWDPPDAVVRKIATAMMNRGPFKLKDEERAWHETFAERFEKQGKSKWRVRLNQPYCD